MDSTLDGAAAAPPARAIDSGFRRMLLFGLLGFSAGLPFYMFSTVLALRLQSHGVALAIIGFFGWVQLLPTVKFLWAPLLDRYDVPGFGRFWGKRRGWIMLAQLGIFTSMVALTSADTSLAITALFAELLAFWTTTLEVAADAWRIELAPTPETQGPLAAATLWGYRSAMVAAGSGALIVADLPGWGWTGAYLAIAAVAFLPFPILATMKSETRDGGGRTVALVTGITASVALLLAAIAATAAAGWVLLAAASRAGLDGTTNITYYVLGFAMAPFLIMAALLPKIVKAPHDSPIRTSTAIGPYVDFFWRYGFIAIVVMGFVAIYRMGDVLALQLSKPMIKELGYSLTEIGIADSYVALIASMVGVGLGGWMAARWPRARTLVIGAMFAALGNFAFVWLAHQPVGTLPLYIATALDQFGNGLAGAVFVVYLSLLVNPRFAGAQYAFLSGWAFLLPRLLAGAGGQVVEGIGWDAFFLASGVVSLAALVFLPAIARAHPREDDR
jgi:PAT family beta-lactamase induction signal transducer AmpG